MILGGVAVAAAVVAALVGTGDDDADTSTGGDREGAAGAAGATVAVTFGEASVGGAPAELTLRFLDAAGDEIARRSWSEVEEGMAADPNAVTPMGGLLQAVPSGDLRLEATLDGDGGGEPASCTQPFRTTRGDRLILRLEQGPLGSEAGGGATIGVAGRGGGDVGGAGSTGGRDCAPVQPVAEWVEGRTGATGEPYVGLTLEQAERRAAREGLTTRVVGVDGMDLAMTMDFRPDRLNLVLFDGRVVAAQLDGEPPAPT
jgi:hypothetical protein